jgi:hypothetical protein
MSSLKLTSQMLRNTAASVLVSASLGFAGTALAASGTGNESGSSGSINHGQDTNQSAGTPSETTPMAPECKSNPSGPGCAQEPHSSSGANGGTGNESYGGAANGGGTSQMKPAVPEATTPAVRNGAAGDSNEAPNHTGK